ncbi:MAG: SCP2 sterol-binding domain-containing protein [Promethearchaeota archaeon]
MKITKWFSEDEIKGSIEKWLKKFDSDSLDGAKDALLYYMALGEAIALSKESDDEDKQELAEIIEDDIEEYESLAYFIEVRGHPEKIVMTMKEDEMKIGLWEGEYEPLPDYKQNVYMEMTPECSLKILKGDPNTDAEFFAGDLTVKGPLKLATKPRDWIAAFFDFVEREPKD